MPIAISAVEILADSIEERPWENGQWHLNCKSRPLTTTTAVRYILDAVSLISRNETGNGKEIKKINEDRNKSEKTESQGQ